MKRALLALALVTMAGAVTAQTMDPNRQIVDTRRLPPVIGGGNGPNSMYIGAAPPPGGGARLDTNVAVYTALRAAGEPIDPMSQNAAALRSDANIATTPGGGARARHAATAIDPMDRVVAAAEDLGLIKNVASAPTPRFTGAAATAQRSIELDGYKSVRNVQRGTDGRWHGTALRGNTQVEVAVAPDGSVSAQ